MTLHIGFTGTREGMTEDQKREVQYWLRHYHEFDDGKHPRFHHGDCFGADVGAAEIAYQMGYHIVCHPPEKNEFRAFFDSNDEVREPKSYLARNRDIVNECSVLIACPRTKDEEFGSGTWYTYKFARKKGVTAVLIPPVCGEHDA